MAEGKFERSADPAAEYLLKKAQEANVETGWDRFSAMQDVCAFGDLGLCCRNCMLGPCRIDPFGEGPQKGVCGISSDGIVARNLCRMIVAGTSAHGDHAAHILEVFKTVSTGEKSGFEIIDSRKLQKVSEQLGLKHNDIDIKGAVQHLINVVQEAYCATRAGNTWLLHTVPTIRMNKLRTLELLPNGIDPAIRETMHRTHIGVDADPLSLLLAAIRCSLADFLGMDIASNLSDIILGTPSLAFSAANLGVLDSEAVNIAVHGHNPLIVESIVRAVPEFEKKAKDAGASHGINIVGVCCGGNEVLTRHGIPLATNTASQEISILTGAVDTMVVDVHCIMPSLANLCECYHTELVNTMSIAKVSDAQSIPDKEIITKKETPPCKLACPIQMDVQGYLALLSEGKFQEAYQLMRRTNPLPAVCGRVCYHPCEDVCNHGYISEPVAIASLKRFVADQVNIEEFEVPEVAKNSKSVAIIGSGPAGLAAAHDLALGGYEVTIFEALPEAGGMLRVGIPEYRLPKDILAKDIGYIQRLGVVIKTNTRVGEQVTLDDLKRDYQAVFIATGAHQSLRLEIPGEEAHEVIPGVDFLRAVNMSQKVEIGNRVAIIGGGNTAIDCARAACRLGDSATIIYRRSRAEMPANQAEIKAAEEEGVEIIFLATPNRISTEDGQVSKIECIRMTLGEPDASGRPQPVPITGSEFTIDVDTVIPALGQTANLEFASGLDLEVSPRGNLVVDGATLATNIEGVFAGSDAVTGPATVTEAIAAGKKVARSIDSYLKEETPVFEEIKAPERLSAQEIAELEKLYPAQKRVVMLELAPAKRIKDFKEVEEGYTLAQAQEEAGRCFACGDWLKGHPAEVPSESEEDLDKRKDIYIPGTQHIELELTNAQECAHKILDTAVQCFRKRDHKKVDIPNIKHETLVGFSPEAILSLLAKINPDDPLQPLIERIASGDIYGIVLFAGCNNYKVVQDSSFISIAEKLAADNVLMLATGCAAGAFAKRGFLSPEATEEICGDKLKNVLKELGNVAGLERPLPPVWHMGSCVDNTRVTRLVFAIANKLNVDLDQLPVVASAPEAMSEKVVAIGMGAVALGLTTHLGVVPPILGGKVVTKILTETLKDLLGARFIVESDPAAAYQAIRETLTEKRIGLGFK